MRRLPHFSLPLICALITFISAPLFAQSKPAARAISLAKTHRAPQTSSGPLIFLPGVDYDSGGKYATSLAVADLNRDGKPDLVVVNQCATIDKFGACIGAGEVSVLLGNGDGTLQSPVVYSTTGYLADWVAVGDLNGDGIPDLVVTSCRSIYKYPCADEGVIDVFVGNGNGTFQPPVTYDSGGLAGGSVAIADVNGDGHPDLVVANGCVENCGYLYYGGVSILLGNGDGTFKPSVNYTSGGLLAWYAALADLTGSGILDIVVVNECDLQNNCDRSSVSVLLGNADGTFQSPIIYLPSGQIGRFAIGDVNGDGTPDLVLPDSIEYCPYTGCVDVMFGNGNGTFQPPVVYDSGGVSAASLALVDMNGDGIPDVVVTNVWFGLCCTGALSILLGNGDGTFQEPFTYFSAGGSGLMSAADVNGDGKPDALVLSHFPADSIGGGVTVFLNNDGAPTTTTSLTSSANPVPVGKTLAYIAALSSQSGGMLGGSVTFWDVFSGASVIGTVPVQNNQATLNITYKHPGRSWVEAWYSGVLEKSAGSVSSLLTQYVCGASTTKVATSGSPSQLGQPVTFTATVKSFYGPIPNSEQVNFYDGSNFLGSASLANGQAAYTTSALSARKHHIKAVYPTDDYFCKSAGQVIQVVQK